MQSLPLSEIQKLIDNGDPVYVINRSGRASGKEMLLILSFPHPTNPKGSTVKLPCIKYPVNLSDMVAPPAAIPHCPAFVEWVNAGIIEVLSPEAGRKQAASPEAKAATDAAYRKLRLRRGEALQMREDSGFRVRQGGARETHAIADLDESALTSADFARGYPGASYSSEPAIEDELADKLQAKVQPQGPLQVQATTIKLRPKIQNFCQDLLDDPTLRGDYLTELKSWDDVGLSEDELGYMLQTLKDFDNICTYLRSIKAKRAGIESELTQQVAPSSKRKRRTGGKFADADFDAGDEL